MELKQDLRLGLRLLSKNPGFTAVAVIVLALGIGINTAIFSVVNVLLLRPLTGVSAGRLVGIYSRDRTKAGSYRAFSYPDYRDLREGNDVFNSVLAHNFCLLGLREGDATRRIFADVVSSNYFSTLGVHLAQGRTFSTEEEAPGADIPAVVVSHAYWKKAGAPSDFGGHPLHLNGRDFTVIGVAPEGFSGTMALLSPEVWIPLGVYDSTLNDFQRKGEHQRLADREHRNLILVGRLTDGVTAAQAEPLLQQAGDRLAQAYPAENKDQVLSLAPLPRLGVSTDPQTTDEPRAAVGMLMAMASLVLLVACLNLANMVLARGEGRRKEIALRLALGAGRARVVRQLLTEGLLLSLVGGAAGLLLAYAATRLLVASLVPLSPLAVVFPAEPDARVIAAALAFCLLATLASGLGPAWKLSRAELLPELKAQAGEHRPLPGRRRLLAPRNLLVVGQVALSLALLSTGGLFVRSALTAADSDPGFRLEQGLVVEVDPALAGDDEGHGRDVYRRVLERLRSLPGVDAVSFASTVPFGPFSISRKVREIGPETATGDGPASGVDAQYVKVGTDYFRSLGLRTLRGRDFEPGEESGAKASRSVIVDEPLARKLEPDGDVLGRLVELAKGSDGESREIGEVVGVVPGLRHDLFDREAVPHVYVPFGSHYQSGMNIHIRVSDAEGEGALLARVRNELLAADPRLPILSSLTLRGYRDGSLDLWLARTAARLFALFGGIALFLAVIGLYGVKAYVVARRTREIGIRMALGASPRNVLGLVLGEGLVLTGIGLGLGLVLALLAGNVVSSLLYRVAPYDPLVITGASLLLGGAALLAAYLPARRATRVTPLTALRYE